MKTVSQTLIDAIWQDIPNVERESSHSEEMFKTPDGSRGSPFGIGGKTDNEVTIQTGGGATLKIDKESFRRVLEYLIRHNHVSRVQFCEIGASRDNPGPLDLTSRIPQSKSSTLEIIYILPLLSGYKSNSSSWLEF
jgi:hypothetical protein